MGRTEFGRRQGQQRGWLRIAGRPRVPCTVQSISLRGAVLDLDVPPWLPLSFELSLDPDARVFNCELRTITDKSIRVVFCARAPESERRMTASPVEEWMGPKATR